MSRQLTVGYNTSQGKPKILVQQCDFVATRDDTNRAVNISAPFRTLHRRQGSHRQENKHSQTTN